MSSIKSISCIAIACILMACQAKESYQLVWEDDFNASTLDTNYWNVDENARGGGNAEMQYYTPRNVTIEKHPLSGESCLVLNAKREDYRNRPATSGRVNTQDKVMATQQSHCLVHKISSSHYGRNLHNPVRHFYSNHR